LNLGELRRRKAVPHQLFKTITIIVILVFCWSCVEFRNIAPQEMNSIPRAEILTVYTNDKKEVEMRNAEVIGDKLVGVAKDKSKIEIDLASIKSVKIKKTNLAWPIVLGCAVAGAVGIFIALKHGEATAPPPPPAPKSCPFIYSFDGKQYVFDAEPYGGAICQGLQRSEWCSLDSLEAVNGCYRLLIANELDETQYTDELKLVVVDHPKGVTIVPENLGRMHTISNPVAPNQAYDQKGRDLIPFIAQKDDRFWESGLEGRNPEKKEDLRDELVFEFPKPAGAKTAKLVANAWTTLWGTQAIEDLLKLFGNKLSDWYAEVNNFGPANREIWNWHFNECLYVLKIYVETPNGWKARGMMSGGGPFISKDKSYPLEISDVPGDTLRIKLTPAAGFWRLNYLAVDYAEDLPIRIMEIGAAEAFSDKGRDERAPLSLSRPDHQYLVMPEKGDYAELIFMAPSQSPDQDRTVFLKAQGYYDIHLEAKGEPQRELIDRIFREPGFTAQIAAKAYFKAKAAKANPSDNRK
jgi:hypothetical protein